MRKHRFECKYCSSLGRRIPTTRFNCFTKRLGHEDEEIESLGNGVVQISSEDAELADEHGPRGCGRHPGPSALIKVERGERMPRQRGKKIEEY